MSSTMGHGTQHEEPEIARDDISVHDEPIVERSDRLPDDDHEVVAGPGLTLTHSMWRGAWVGALAGAVGGAGVGALAGLVWAGFNQGNHDARLVIICVAAFALAGAVIAFMLAGMAGAVTDADPEQAPEDSAHHNTPRG